MHVGIEVSRSDGMYHERRFSVKRLICVVAVAFVQMAVAKCSPERAEVARR